MSSKARKVAFFDFCETLVSFQTADAFVDFVRGAERDLFMQFLNISLVVLEKINIIKILNKLFPDRNIGKKLKLMQLRGFTSEKLDDLARQFYLAMIKPGIIKPVIEEMNSLREQDYEVCIVSAGYSVYLRYFAADYQIKDVISTEIAFDISGNLCKGTISGRDCSNNEKVNRVKAYYKGQKIDFKECISYSDSLSDLPILLLAGKAVVISRNQPQEWCSRYKFKEIIWE